MNIQSITTAPVDIETVLNHPEVGTQSWWQTIRKQGTPVIQSNVENKNFVTLLFLWQDPEGDETTSKTHRVYIDLNCITDHRTYSPESLVRVKNTNVWYWETSIENNWRGSYRLIPITLSDLPVSADLRAENQRRWWRSLLKQAIPDPLNKMSPVNCPWSERLSAIHLPEAPAQTVWQTIDVNVSNQGAGLLRCILWSSQQLGTHRNVWIYTTDIQRTSLTPFQLKKRPLVILLDGEFWAEDMPIFSALDNQVRKSCLPDCVYVLIDSINPKQRAHDLTCNRAFWQAVQHELLPLIQTLAPHSDHAQHTIVAGQSFGALGALFAAITWPKRFGCVVSQSGSFWWPNIELMKLTTTEALQNNGTTGQLIEQLEKSTTTNQPISIYQEAGDREITIGFVNDRLQQALVRAGHHVTYQKYSGGHDRICWRGGLIEGISYFLSTLSIPIDYSPTL